MQCPILASACFSKKDPDFIIASLVLFCLINLYSFINSFASSRRSVYVGGFSVLFLMGWEITLAYAIGVSHFVMQYFVKCTAHPILRMAQITGLCHHEIFYSNIMKAFSNGTRN